jgi:DNA-binding Lrp family transcriptional regulator
MDALDRRIINRLQQGFPISERPYAEVAMELGIDETELLTRLQTLLDRGKLSRFGPIYDAEKTGGAFSLVAMQVPPDRFEEVAAIVNGFPEVAHNYEREHAFNMWFVLATESPQRIAEINEAIRQRTGIPVFDMPKQEEYFLRLNLVV